VTVSKQNDTSATNTTVWQLFTQVAQTIRAYSVQYGLVVFLRQHLQSLQCLLSHIHALDCLQLQHMSTIHYDYQYINRHFTRLAWLTTSAYLLHTSTPGVEELSCSSIVVHDMGDHSHRGWPLTKKWEQWHICLRSWRILLSGSMVCCPWCIIGCTHLQFNSSTPVRRLSSRWISLYMPWQSSCNGGFQTYLGRTSMWLILGGLHTEMAALRTIGDILDGSGWTDALTQADIATAGTYEGDFGAVCGPNVRPHQWTSRCTCS